MTQFNNPDEPNSELNELEERVVFSESFDPQALFGDSCTRDIKLLTALAFRCDPLLSPQSAMRWALKPDVRASTLKRLSENKCLHSRFYAQSKFANGFGLWMLDLLKGKLIDPDELSISQQASLRTAMQFVQGYLSAGVADRLESRLEWLQTKRALMVALPSGLIGRNALLKKLIKRVSAINTHHLKGKTSTILVSGIGGSGKSALLSQFALEQIDLLNYSVIFLDFDSPNLSVPRPDRFMIAFARQLAMYHPEHASPLRKFASNLEKFLSVRESGSNSYRELSYLISIVRSTWQKFCSGIDIERLPTILILDTFEEVIIRGQADLRLIEQWIQSLKQEYGFHKLSLIVSGRSLPDNIFSSLSDNNISRIDVNDLPITWAVKFLHKQAQGSITKIQARTLVKQYGGNPLVLKLIGRLVQEGENPIDIDPDVGRETAQSFLYDRILNRLRTRDHAVADLAHPGLVLRRITPSIIYNVLANSLQLNNMTQERSQNLFDELARQVWLVESGASSNVLLHRKDLRRLMLKLMYKSDRRDQLDSVHLEAIKYYENVDLHETDSSTARVEANYHKIFLYDPALGREEALTLVRSLGTDIECIPIERSAKLRQQAGIDLTTDELDTLSPSDRVAEEEKARIRINKVTLASENYYTFNKDNQPSRLSSGELDYLFASGEWHTIVSRAQFWVKEYLTQTAPNVDERNALTESSIWKLCLAFLFADKVKAQKKEEILTYLLSSSKSLEGQPYIKSRRHHIETSEAFQAAAGLLNGTGYSFTGQWRRSNVLSTIDEVRLWLLLPLLPKTRKILNSDLYIHPTAFRFLTKDFESALEEESRKIGATDNLQGWLFQIGEMVIQGPSLGEIGKIALDAKPIHFQGNSVAIRKLGGVVLPELYPLCRHALRSVPKVILETFTTNEAAGDAYWPRDLTGAYFREQLNADPDRTLSVLLEISDRLGRVPALLKLGLSSVSNKKPLQRAIQAWEQLEERLLSSLETSTHRSSINRAIDD